MKLETVSKVKGWVAVLSWTVFFLALLPAFVPGDVHSRPVIAGLGFLFGAIYTVKWIRLKRFMRTAHYAARVLRNG